MKKLAFALVGIFACVLGQSVASAQEFEVKPVGIQVVWENLREEFDGFGTMNQTQNGLTLAIAATISGEKKIVEFDGDDCRINKFVDSEGKKLEGEVGHFARVGESGKVLRFEIESEQLPGEGASSIEVEGEFPVDVASKSETVKTETVEYAKGETLGIGDVLKTKITEIGETSFGDMKATVTLEAKKAWPAYAAIRFYDADGKKIESEKGGHSRMSMLGSVTESRTYRLARKPESFRVEMDVWSDLETLTVPFSVKAGLGK